MEDKLLLIQNQFNKVFQVENLKKVAEKHILNILNEENLGQLCKEEKQEITILEMVYERTKVTFFNEKVIEIEFGIFEKDGILPKYDFISLFDENGIFKKNIINKNY